ncbi:MAG: DUF6886 family protein [Leptolyngbyaceae cyanobacterium]
MQLFHFSDNPNIDVFVPRPVRIPVERPIGFEWLNGPLVWAIQDSHEAMYLFPRECPRILLWRTPDTTEEDYQLWWKGSTAECLVYIEEAWLNPVNTATIYRYNLPTEAFVSLKDAGMWVAKTEVTPISSDALTQLPKEHQKRNIELRTLDNLLPLKGVWQTSLHASGIRLRNAQRW